MSDTRSDQINQQVLQALSSLTRSLKDPRLDAFYTLTHADVSRDFRHAKIYVSVLGAADGGKQVVKGLTSAAGHLRRELGKAVIMHHTPELTFILDDSLAHGAKISNMLSDMGKEERYDAE